jgi:hypothetical protein
MQVAGGRQRILRSDRFSVCAVGRFFEESDFANRCVAGGHWFRLTDRHRSRAHLYLRNPADLSHVRLQFFGCTYALLYTAGIFVDVSVISMVIYLQIGGWRSDRREETLRGLRKSGLPHRGDFHRWHP